MKLMIQHYPINIYTQLDIIKDYLNKEDKKCSVYMNILFETSEVLILFNNFPALIRNSCLELYNIIQREIRFPGFNSIIKIR